MLRFCPYALHDRRTITLATYNVVGPLPKGSGPLLSSMLSVARKGSPRLSVHGLSRKVEVCVPLHLFHLLSLASCSCVLCSMRHDFSLHCSQVWPPGSSDGYSFSCWLQLPLLCEHNQQPSLSLPPLVLLSIEHRSEGSLFELCVRSGVVTARVGSVASCSALLADRRVANIDAKDTSAPFVVFSVSFAANRLS